MDIPELKKRWLLSKIRPEYFYAPLSSGLPCFIFEVDMSTTSSDLYSINIGITNTAFPTYNTNAYSFSFNEMRKWNVKEAEKVCPLNLVIFYNPRLKEQGECITPTNHPELFTSDPVHEIEYNSITKQFTIKKISVNLCYYDDPQIKISYYTSDEFYFIYNFEKYTAKTKNLFTDSKLELYYDYYPIAIFDKDKSYLDPSYKYSVGNVSANIVNMPWQNEEIKAFKDNPYLFLNYYFSPSIYIKNYHKKIRIYIYGKNIPNLFLNNSSIKGKILQFPDQSFGIKSLHNFFSVLNQSDKININTSFLKNIVIISQLKSWNENGCLLNENTLPLDDFISKMPNLVYANNAFYYCSYSDFPERTFFNKKYLRDCRECFDYNRIIKSDIIIGDYFFANCPQLLDISYCFNNNGSNILCNINNGIFENDISLRKVHYWSYSLSIKKVGNNLFKNCKSLTHLGYFQDDYGDGYAEFHFSNTYGYSNYSYIFGSNPIYLEEVGEGLFENCENLIDVIGLFSNANQLQRIGNNIFKGCKSLRFVDYFLYDNYKLTEIPDNIFADIDIFETNPFLRIEKELGESISIIISNNFNYNILSMRSCVGQWDANSPKPISHQLFIPKNFLPYKFLNNGGCLLIPQLYFSNHRYLDSIINYQGNDLEYFNIFKDEWRKTKIYNSVSQIEENNLCGYAPDFWNYQNQLYDYSSTITNIFTSEESLESLISFSPTIESLDLTSGIYLIKTIDCWAKIKFNNEELYTPGGFISLFQYETHDYTSRSGQKASFSSLEDPNYLYAGKFTQNWINYDEIPKPTRDCSPYDSLDDLYSNFYLECRSYKHAIIDASGFGYSHLKWSSTDEEEYANYSFNNKMIYPIYKKVLFNDKLTQISSNTEYSQYRTNHTTRKGRIKIRQPGNYTIDWYNYISGSVSSKPNLSYNISLNDYIATGSQTIYINAGTLPFFHFHMTKSGNSWYAQGKELFTQETVFSGSVSKLSSNEWQLALSLMFRAANPQNTISFEEQSSWNEIKPVCSFVSEDFKAFLILLGQNGVLGGSSKNIGWGNETTESRGPHWVSGRNTYYHTDMFDVGTAGSARWKINEESSDESSNNYQSMTIGMAHSQTSANNFSVTFSSNSTIEPTFDPRSNSSMLRSNNISYYSIGSGLYKYFKLPNCILNQVWKYKNSYCDIYFGVNPNYYIKKI